MNCMKIHEIKRVGQNRFEYAYTVEGEWCRFFEPSNPMWAEYSVPVDQVPDSIAVLPLIGNVIVLASLMDADIYVDEIDREFYECIEEFIQGFDNIMPEHVHFKHRDIVHANKIVDNPLSETEQAENLLFFSGGVDATCSLVEHLEEKPALVTIWGADIPWDNEETWNRAIGFNQEVADQHGLNLLTIRSNFRKSLNEDNLSDLSMKLVGNWWWPAFHHGLAMMCLAAPFAHKKRKSLYLGSSFSSRDMETWGVLPTASAPQIDNHVRFCGCQVVHDGFALSRFDKIRCICQYYQNQKIKPFLRVCYLSNEGSNCGHCEKCARTIFSILLLGENPNDYGFTYSESQLPVFVASGLQEMARTEKIAFMAFYADIQAELRRKFTIEQIPAPLQAFYSTDLDHLANFLQVPNNELTAKEKVFRTAQDQLYQEIGQLRYKLQVRDSQIQQLQHTVDTLNGNKKSFCAEMAAEMESVQQQNRILEEELQKLHCSTSWKVTKPLRFLGRVLRFLKHKLPL